MYGSILWTHKAPIILNEFLPNYEHFNEQSLEVFRYSFHSFYFFGFKNVKIIVYCAKILFWCIFIKVKCRCLQIGPGDLTNTKHFKFDIRQIFYASLKNHIFQDFEAHVKSLYAFYFI